MPRPAAFSVARGPGLLKRPVLVLVRCVLVGHFALVVTPRLVLGIAFGSR
jgi:hypothetical protein